MKQCPKCGTMYTDVSLTYCLADGSVLVENAEQATLERSPNNAAGTADGQFRVVVPQDVAAPAYVQPPPVESGSGWLKIILLVGLVLAMLLGAAAIAGALIYFNKDSRTAAISSSNAVTDRSTPNLPGPPTNSDSPANAESEKLREQIANLEKRLEAQKNSSQPTVNAPTAPDQPITTSGTARVNSPGDGFLALRSLPSSDIGERIVQIPNGSILALGGCLARSRAGIKYGRWCRASYNGHSGWVFDAWLQY